jgi:hypothetical protein
MQVAPRNLRTFIEIVGQFTQCVSTLDKTRDRLAFKEHLSSEDISIQINWAICLDYVYWRISTSPCAQFRSPTTPITAALPQDLRIL